MKSHWFFVALGIACLMAGPVRLIGIAFAEPSASAPPPEDAPATKANGADANTPLRENVSATRLLLKGRGTGVRTGMSRSGFTKASERAVGAALNWLSRHQDSDGGWSLIRFSKTCQDGSCTGFGADVIDSAATPLALLPYLNVGQTHQSQGPYKHLVGSALQYLTSHQKADGDLRMGGNMYTHGLTAIALCETYDQTADNQIGTAAQQAINFIEQAQDPTGGGWNEEPQKPGNLLTSGWQITALRTAQSAGLTVKGETLERATAFLKSVRDAQGGFGNTEPARGLTTTAIGVFCSQNLRINKNDPLIASGVQFLSENLPTVESDDCYYRFFGMQVMHNLQGVDWDLWHRRVRRMLIDSQVRYGCAVGSWSPQKDVWSGGENGGRVALTALNCLTMETYFRALPQTTEPSAKPENESTE